MEGAQQEKDTPHNQCPNVARACSCTIKHSDRRPNVPRQRQWSAIHDKWARQQISRLVRRSRSVSLLGSWTSQGSCGCARRERRDGPRAVRDLRMEQVGDRGDLHTRSEQVEDDGQCLSTSGGVSKPEKCLSSGAENR